MTNIGYFTKQESGAYTGTLETLAIKSKVSFEPADKRSGSSPDFRVTEGLAQIGSAWERKGKKGTYLSVRIDDPFFSAPIHCRLVHTGIEHGFDLMWDRRRHAQTSNSEGSFALEAVLRDLLSRFKSCIGGGNGEIEGDREAIEAAEALLVARV